MGLLIRIWRAIFIFLGGGFIYVRDVECAEFVSCFLFLFFLFSACSVAHETWSVHIDQLIGLTVIVKVVGATEIELKLARRVLEGNRRRWRLRVDGSCGYQMKLTGARLMEWIVVIVSCGRAGGRAGTGCLGLDVWLSRWSRGRGLVTTN